MEQSSNEILKYIHLIIQRKYLFIISSLIIMSVIVWGSFFIPPKYEAKSTMFIEANVIEELVEGIAITPSMEARVRVLKDTMLSRSLVLNVLRKLDLDAGVKNEEALESMIEHFQKKTSLDVQDNDLRSVSDNLIKVAFTSKDPVLARDYVNTLISEYVESNIFAKREEAYDATDFLEKQVAFFKQKMDKGEDAIIEFRKEKGIYAAVDEAAIIVDIRNYERAIEEVKMQVDELTASSESIKKQLKEVKPFTVAMYSSQSIDERIRSLENKLNVLLIDYTEYYPEVIRVKAEIETLKLKQSSQTADSPDQTDSEISAANPVYQELNQRVIEIDAQINALKARRKHMETLIVNKEMELKEIPESKKQLADLTKDRDSFLTVYQELLTRLGQSEVSKQMEIEDKASTFRIIEPAILPVLPVSPNRVKLILLGILAGFAGGFGIIFLLDYTDHSIKSVESLKLLGFPVFAIIPEMRSSEAVIKQKKKDVLLYSLSGTYMTCILVVLAIEFYKSISMGV
jgi:polysaccharide chain length determinant protein (PEP-CTERM system associated)